MISILGKGEAKVDRFCFSTSYDRTFSLLPGHRFFILLLLFFMKIFCLLLDLMINTRPVFYLMLLILVISYCSKFSGRIWRIDVGMSSGVFDSRPEVIC